VVTIPQYRYGCNEPMPALIFSSLAPRVYGGCSGRAVASPSRACPDLAFGDQFEELLLIFYPVHWWILPVS